MKKIALALLVSISLLTPMITRPFSWNVVGHLALLIANTGSAVQWVKQHRTYPPAYRFAHLGTVGFLYYYSASQLLKAYQEYKHRKENITVRG